MRVLVVGMGSAGTRHARLLAERGAEVTGWDVEAEHESWAGFDGIVIASPSHLHLEHTAKALAAGARVLVEKPLATSLDGLESVCGTGRVMVAHNLRHHVDLVEFWLKLLAEQERWGRHLTSVVAWCHTPPGNSAWEGLAWHSAVHELDLLSWLCGPLEVADRFVGSDMGWWTLAGSGVVVTLSVGYSRRYRRGMRARFASGPGCSVRYGPDVVESYEAQADVFLRFLAGGECPVTAEDGAEAVRLALGAPGPTPLWISHQEAAERPS